MRRFGLLGDVAVGELAGDDDVAVAQLDDVAVGVDVGDEQALVRLDAAGDVVQVRALASSRLTCRLIGPALGLHLELDAGLRESAPLPTSMRVEVQVRGRCRPGP